MTSTNWYRIGFYGFCGFLLCFFSGCLFGVKNSGKVKSYSPGLVRTQKGFYKVGPIDSAWKRVKVQDFKSISFRHNSYQSTISTAAFCDGSYEDAALSVLTLHLHAPLSERVIQSERTISLNHRTALRTVVRGKVDGVAVIVDTVVVKKDDCLFDFSLVSAPIHYRSANRDFENFYQGFEFQGEL